MELAQTQSPGKEETTRTMPVSRPSNLIWLSSRWLVKIRL